MNKLEETAYQLCQSHCLVDEYGKAESAAMDAMLEFAKSNVAKQFHTKEAMGLIEELASKVDALNSYLNPPSTEIKDLITKAEQFLNETTP